MIKKLLSLSSLAVILISISAFAPAGYSVGDKVSDFSLKNIDGKMVSLADYKEAKGFIVVFTCNHCPFAKLYEERIVALDAKYKSKGYPVIAINPNDVKIAPDDSYENMQARAKEKGFTFPYLYDESQTVAKAFGATRTPHVYILEKGKDGLKVKYIGAIDNNTEDGNAATDKYVESAVNALLKGEKVNTTQTKAIGCTIKWKTT